MRVSRIRLGFATNSSSTHSIVLLNPGVVLSDKEIKPREEGFDYLLSTSSVMASPEPKKAYLSEMLFLELQYGVGLTPETANNLVLEWLGAKSRPALKTDVINYQDFPRTWDAKLPDREFFTQFLKFIGNPDVAVIGGWDGSQDEKIEEIGASFHKLYPSKSGNLVCRYDEKADYWAVFDRGNGEKVNLSFNREAGPYEKAFAPELVDLKITDQCDQMCPYCYQGSSPDGKHADMRTIERVAELLAELEVFEVAVGGGEPLLHPDFALVLETFRNRRVVPNFSTRKLDWVENEEQREKIFNNMGAFAYSIVDPAEMKPVAAVKEKFKLYGRASAQYALGTGESVEDIMRASSKHTLRLTLLGFKSEGRGAEFKTKEDGDWLDALIKLDDENVYPWSLGIDTAIAAAYGERIKNIHVFSSISYYTQEGKFSMYIDAVNHKIGPSSFCAPEEMVDVDLNSITKQELVSIWERF